jgi:hypothetical protein
MIRFIDLTNQIVIPVDDEVWHEFAFFNTVNDRFLTFSGNQTWHTVKDFVDDFATDQDNGYADEPMRFLGLIPQHKGFYGAKWGEYGE